MGIFAGIFCWYAYTRVYWFVAGLHASLPPCPFLYLTGQPCPFCGGTRSFASIWQGDLRRALAFHPLGPVYFVAGLGIAAVTAWTALSGRRPRLDLDHRQERRLYLLAAAVALAGWVLKLVWVGDFSR